MSLAMLLALGLSTHTLRAQDSDAETRTAARDLAAQGAEAFERQDYATALDRFTRAFSLVKAPSISVMEARSLAKLGRMLEALDKYERTQRTPLAEDAPDAFRQAVSDAQREGRELWRRVPRLMIHARVPRGTSESLKILLDSKPVPAALLDVQRPIDPGLHQVDAAADGYDSVSRVVTVQAGDQVTLDIPLNSTMVNPQTVPTLVPTARPVAGDPPNRDSRSAASPWGWAAVGVGTAGLLLSTVTGVIALEKKSTLDSLCSPGCPPRAADDISAFRTARTLSYVGLLGGAAFFGAGSYVLLSGSHDGAALGASVGPMNANLWGTF
jgi:hypothetical protein